MQDKISNNQIQLGGLGVWLLTCVLASAKVNGYPISWWIVFAPIWGPPAAVVSVLVFIVVAGALLAVGATVLWMIARLAVMAYDAVMRVRIRRRVRRVIFR